MDTRNLIVRPPPTKKRTLSFTITCDLSSFSLPCMQPITAGIIKTHLSFSLLWWKVEKARYYYPTLFITGAFPDLHFSLEAFLLCSDTNA